MSTKEHPLAQFVFELAEKGKIVDVTSVAAMLSGATCFSGRNATKGRNAYRIVAADILCCMAEHGDLIQHQPWQDDKHPEDGGAYFESAPNKYAEDWMENTVEEILDRYAAAGTPVRGGFPILKAIRAAYLRGTQSCHTENP